MATSNVYLLIIVVSIANFMPATLAYVMQQECAKFGNQTARQGLVVSVETWMKVSLTERHGYEANLDCTVTFKTEKNRILLFKLDDLEMERSRDCVNDFLLISNTIRGDVVLCGSGKRVDSFYSTNSTITLRFVSNRDLMNTMRGFNGYFTVLYTGQACSDKRFFSCKNEFCIDEELECNGVDNCGDNSDEILCKEKQWYVVSLVVASLILGSFFIIAIIAYFTKRRNRQRDNNGDDVMVDPTSFNKKGSFRSRLNFKKKSVNFSTPVVDMHQSASVTTLEDSPAHQNNANSTTPGLIKWNQLIFDNKKQGQVHLYSVPDTQNFTDLKNCAEDSRLSCPEFLAVQELLRTSCGPKGFTSDLLTRNLTNQRRASLHQLCALCLLANMEKPNSPSLAKNQQPQYLPNFTGYKCPHSCPKDPTAFYLQQDDCKLPTGDSTPRMAILSRAPSFYLNSDDTTRKTSPDLIGNNITPTNTTRTPRQGMMRTSRSFLSGGAEKSAFFSPASERRHYGGSNRPLTIITPNSRFCDVEGNDNEQTAPLLLPVADGGGKKTEINVTYKSHHNKTSAPFLPPRPLSTTSLNKCGTLSANNRRRSCHQDTLSHDIVCKHKGKKVRILSRMLSVPSPTEATMNCFDVDNDDDDDDSDDDLTLPNNNNNKQISSLSKDPSLRQICAYRVTSADDPNNNNNRKDVTYAVVNRRPHQHQHRHHHHHQNVEQGPWLCRTTTIHDNGGGKVQQRQQQQQQQNVSESLEQQLMCSNSD